VHFRPILAKIQPENPNLIQYNFLALKILERLRTASLNSEFTGSYKKKCIAV